MRTSSAVSKDIAVRVVRRALTPAVIVACALVFSPADVSAIPPGGFSVKKASVGDNIQKLNLVAGGTPQIIKAQAGKKYLWVQFALKNTAELPTTIDLLAVNAIASDKVASPLAGLDFLLGDESPTLSISVAMADAYSQMGGSESEMEVTIDNLAQTKAVLTVRKPRTFSLTFEVPEGPHKWEITGLGTSPIAVTLQ